jgi:two-component system, sensor histidine kinase
MARSRSRKKTAVKVSRRPRKPRVPEAPIFIKRRPAKSPFGKPSEPESSAVKSSAVKSSARKSPSNKVKPLFGKSSARKPSAGKLSAGKPAAAKSSSAKPSSGKLAADAASPNAAEASLVAYAHDIRTALTGILALSELLATSTIGERERRWAVGIKGSAEHLSGLTTLMIDAAQA